MENIFIWFPSIIFLIIFIPLCIKWYKLRTSKIINIFSYEKDILFIFFVFWVFCMFYSLYLVYDFYYNDDVDKVCINDSCVEIKKHSIQSRSA